MRELLDSLSLGSGALLVAVVSGVMAIWCARLSAASLWLLSLIVPFLLAVALYWSPVFLGANAADFSSWAPLVVGVWFLSGFVAFASVTYWVRILRRA
jgi:hypothetical protein